MTDSPGQRCVAEWRQNVAFAIACAAYNQPLMGMDWAKPQNRRWLEAADRLLEQLAPDIDAAIEARTELMEAEARHAALVIVRRERAQALREAADTFASTDGYVYAMKHGDPGATIRERVIDWLRARAAEEEKG